MDNNIFYLTWISKIKISDWFEFNSNNFKEDQSKKENRYTCFTIYRQNIELSENAVH